MAKVIIELSDSENGGVDLLVKGESCCPCSKCKNYPGTNAQCAQMVLQEFFTTEDFNERLIFFISKYLVDSIEA